jgi:hypothetical protein
MSPEQVRGQPADARSDLFALGAILYELLSGKRAFHGASYVETLNAILKEEPAPLSASRRDIPPALEIIVRRCLEKSPDERFQNARDLAFALESTGSGQAQPQGAPTAAAGPQHRRRLAWAVAAAAIPLVGVGTWLAWGPLSRWLGGQHAAQPAKKEWILVAEFEGPRDDPDLARAAQGVTAAALDQSGIVMTVPRDHLKVALENAGRPDTLRVDGPLARELAYRNGIRAVLEGRVSRVGTGYSVVLRLSDSSNDSTLIGGNGSARDGHALIPTLDQMARQMRRKLGENPAGIRATRGLNVIITPSFEAYRKIEQAASFLYETDDEVGANRLLREALDLDPDCAAAYVIMAANLQSQGTPDSAVWACDQALKRRDRLSDEQRFFVEASRAYYVADLEGALQTLNRQLQLFPSGPNAGRAYTLRSAVKYYRRQWAEAVEDARCSIKAMSFGPDQRALQECIQKEIAAGQLGQAGQTLGRLNGPSRPFYAVQLAVARGQWARAESLSANPPADVANDPGVLEQARHLRMALHARRGEVRAAQGESQVDSRLAPGRSHLFLPMYTGTRPAELTKTVASDTSTSALVTRGWHAALAGDLSTAHRALAALRRRSAVELARAGSAPSFLEAVIAAAESRWGDVIRSLGPIALRGDENGSWTWRRIGTPPVRWLVAEAYDRLGPPDSAAVAFERVLEPPESRGGGYVPYAHQRLVMIYAGMGRGDDAERHWHAFSAVFTNPDPDVKHLLDDARAAIEGMRSMARPERPRT